MEEQFVKENPIQELSNLDKQNELKESIKKSKIILMNMHNNLKFAEGELIDYYIYQIKAEEAKYDYLIKKAKEIF
ncbi:MAG: DUF2508 family protein [Clostridia bacterium]|nr:DUF2508 family protein [Clostridia bacterium]